MQSAAHLIVSRIPNPIILPYLIRQNLVVSLLSDKIATYISSKIISTITMIAVNIREILQSRSVMNSNFNLRLSRSAHRRHNTQKVNMSLILI